MKAIDKARNDQRILSLLDSIGARIKLRFQKSRDDGWSSNLQRGVATIGYTGCRHPSAALAHELLHVDTQLRGYRRIRVGISSIDQTSSFKRLMNCLDNELQHHKFYARFLAMGFPPEQFYRDSDAETEGHLVRSAGGTYAKLIDVLPDFLSAIAPGGDLDEESRSRLRNQFLEVSQGAYSNELRRIEALFAEWAKLETFDAVKTIKKIMLTIQPVQNYTWFGFDGNARPPDPGFFVDAEFTPVET